MRAAVEVHVLAWFVFYFLMSSKLETTIYVLINTYSTPETISNDENRITR